MSKVLKLAAIKLAYLEVKGIYIKDINTHSLRSGVTNAIHLEGYKDRETQKMCQWKSDTLKDYISYQLHSFYKGVLMDMKSQQKKICFKGGAIRNITR